MPSRLDTLCGHIKPLIRSQLTSAKGAPSAPDIDIFINFSSVESYLGLQAILDALNGCNIHWHWTRAATRNSVVVGSSSTHLKHSAIQTYQLSISKIYAGERGLRLDVPHGEVNVSSLEDALMYATCFETSSVVEKFLRLAFAAVFDPVNRAHVDASIAEYFLTSVCGGTCGFADWPEAAKAEARKNNIDMEKSHGVWDSPYIVDRETGEVFIGIWTLELLVLRLKRRGYEFPEERTSAHVNSTLHMFQVDKRMHSRKQIEVYVDLKSPYAFLAIEPTYALAEDFDIELVWRPYNLDIPSFLGSAQVGPRDNKVKDGTNRRSPKQWLAVKYAYGNNRRYAVERKPPLILYGTRKIWDTTLVGVAMLFAIAHGKLRAFQQRIWPLFWRRELDAEDSAALISLLRSADIDTDGYDEFARGEGLRQFQDIQKEAVNRGVFGVPSYILDGELYFGREHLPLLRRRLFDAGCAKHNNPSVLLSPYLWRRNDLFASF